MTLFIVAAYRILEQELLPPIAALRASVRLTKLISKREADQRLFEGLAFDKHKQEALLAQVREEYKSEVDRRNRLVDKGKSALFIIGVTIPLMFTVLSATKTIGFLPHELVVLAVGILYLVLAAFCATTAVAVKPFHGVYLDDLFGTDGKTIFGKNPKTDELIAMYYHSVKLNQWGIANISNFVDASYTGIRNGIALLALVFLLALARPHLSPATSRPTGAITARVFNGPSGAVQFIRGEKNCVEKVVIPMHPFTGVYDPLHPEKTSVVEAGLVIYFCGGRVEVVGPKDAEAILNSGVLHEVPIRTQLGR